MTNFDVSAAPAWHLRKDQQPGLPGKKEDDEARGQAWQREMERAQMQAWLSHGVVGHAASPGSGLPSAVACVAALPTISPDAETLAPGGASTTPAQGAPASASGSVLAAQTGVSRTQPNTTAQARGITQHKGPTVPRSEVPMPQQLPSLPSAASARAKEMAASHRHWLPPGLAVAAAAVAARQGASLVDGNSAPLQQSQANDSAARAAPPNFNAESLTQALQRFGAIEATTGPTTTGMNPPSAAGSDEKLRGLSRAAQVIAIAAERAGEPPRGLGVAASVQADSALQPHAPAQRSIGQPGRPQKVSQVSVADAAREPIRVHADWSEDGVRLWLGMDAGALDLLEQITTQLQAWLNTQGLRLRSLSCNGQILSQDPAPPESFGDAPEIRDSAVTAPITTPKESS